MRTPFPIARGRRCPRCGTRLERRISEPGAVTRWVLAAVPGLRWRWCRRCMWTGFVWKGRGSGGR